LIFTSLATSEFNTHIIPTFSNYKQSQSEIVLSNSIHTKFGMEHVQKFCITALFTQLNMYLLYLFNYSSSFLSSLFSTTRAEMEVSLK
jgi:hypothetical protein